MKSGFLLYQNQELAALVEPLLAWYHANRRVLPWRENTDPYRVWISEIMLQQTRVEAVREAYVRFIAELPDVRSLARVSEERLYKLWEGLGYYSRARNLQKAARVVCEQYGGVFPSDAQTLAALPGIGEYTAGAIASIAFEKPTPAVDGNVLRVISRLCENPTDITTPSYKKEVANVLARIYPPTDRGSFTQALMELGAMVCLPGGAPLCERCPLFDLCRCGRKGTWERYPVKRARPARKVEHQTVFLLWCDGKIAVRKREGGGVLQGMWELPCVTGELTPEQVRVRLCAWGITGKPMAQKTKKHIFTHIEWIMHPYILQCPVRSPAFTWTEPDAVALPTAFKKIL